MYLTKIFLACINGIKIYARDRKEHSLGNGFAIASSKCPWIYETKWGKRKKEIEEGE